MVQQQDKDLLYKLTKSILPQILTILSGENLNSFTHIHKSITLRHKASIKNLVIPKNQIRKKIKPKKNTASSYNSFSQANFNLQVSQTLRYETK